MKVLVTGADGFVGRHVLAALVGSGHAVVATKRPSLPPPGWAAMAPFGAVPWIALELEDEASVAAAASHPCDAVLHLAALASGQEARRSPAAAWTVNAVGTVRLLEALAVGSRARAVVVSTGEVYGDAGAQALTEGTIVRPASPYAASKAAAEIGALEIGRRTGLPVVVARPFAHTGPGQAPIYVAPSFAARIRDAARTGRPTISTGSLSPIRDFLDVRDVARAYVGLLESGQPGEAYNIASGVGVALSELLRLLAEAMEVDVVPETDPALLRTADIPCLIGDATKLRAATGWAPMIPFSRTLRDLIDAQAD
jgi:GDP-4-dehydro-6-deoxy-D-mannose reductase